MNNRYTPEGLLLNTSENKEYISSLSGLERAMNEGRILESTVLLCDNKMRLHVDLYGIEGIIERDETLYSQDGSRIKDIAVTGVERCILVKLLNM